MWREVGARQAEATNLFVLSGVARHLGEPELALERADESLAIFRELNDVFGMACALVSLSRCHIDEGDEQRALLGYREALLLWSDIGDRYGIVKALAGLAMIAARNGQLEAATVLASAVDSLQSGQGLRLAPV